MDIAFSDIGDYLSFKKQRKNKWTVNSDGEDIPVINTYTGEQDCFEYNVVEINDSKEVNTSILKEVSEGKDGVKIKLQDKIKNIQWLAEELKNIDGNIGYCLNDGEYDVWNKIPFILFKNNMILMKITG